MDTQNYIYHYLSTITVVCRIYNSLFGKNTYTQIGGGGQLRTAIKVATVYQSMTIACLMSVCKELSVTRIESMSKIKIV